MCGIAGFSLKENLDQKVNILKVMNDKLSHRGPDGEGFYHDSDVSLSHKRLAILDLNERSNQPFFDKNKEHAIVFNGEIYNYLELKKILKAEGFKFDTTGDTEVLLNSYIRWDLSFLEKIKGMFSFAIYNIKKKQIICARDHFGQKPFFYYYKNGNFIFSSELTSLISNPIIKEKICIKSVSNYLHYDAFVGSSTPITNCYKLLPSEYLVYDLNKKSIHKSKFWNLEINEKKVNSNDYYDQFINQLTQSTKLHLRSDVPIALYLSGGIDSSSLACISKKILKAENLTAFNLKFKDETFNEHILAQDTADKLKINLTTYNLEDTNFISNLSTTINSIDEPLADLGLIAISFIANFVSKDGYKVVISGDGGDELLMGYEPFQKYWLYKYINKISILSKSIKYISSLMPDNYGYMGPSHKIKIFSKALGFPSKYANSRWICSYLPEEIFQFLNNSENQSLKNDDIYAYIINIIKSTQSKNDYDQLTIQYQKHFLSNLICNHTDKANMQFSIEARSPFLDPDLFNFTNKLPKNLKLNFNSSKLFLRKFLKKTINNSTYKSRKKGFTVPMASWINNELKNLILDTLNKENFQKIGFFNYDYFYKNIIVPHVENKSNNHKKIWNVFVLINWLKNNKLI